MKRSLRRILFLLFFVSGFSGLVYQVVWTRMAFASFGIITPVLSVVLSVFMLGLSAGAWAAGRMVRTLTERTGRSAILLYAAAELMIGVGAFAVPFLFHTGERWLLAAGQADSARYLSLSALVLVISILPWCLFMGATFPLMMAYIRERSPSNVGGFSFLYLANVLGAMSGTLLTAVALVEWFGFRHTLWIAAAGNWLVALISVKLGRARRRASEPPRAAGPAAESPLVSLPFGVSRRAASWILFSTGFSAMAMEVVWTRAFTPVLKTQVYSFAAIVFAYLGATFVGSWFYRWHRRKGVSPISLAQLISSLAITVFLPIVLSDPRIARSIPNEPLDFGSAVMVVLSICPFCAVLGYLTPGLIDEYSAGHPREAGRAYAFNVLGCILGPLLVCYALLPNIAERYVLLLLGLPFLGFWAWKCAALPRRRRWGSGLAVAGATLISLLVSRSFEERVMKTHKNSFVRRDYAASVIAYGEDMEKRLLVNGIGMTFLTPITKYMVHLPLAFHAGKPQSALIICFGMGTSYRSALSWDLQTTAVELIPSVPRAFGFYHADAADLARNSRGRIVIDDGRRYLQRCEEQFDLIVVDPPPPVEAAGSSLLYSPEFYELAKRHLKPDGILAAWYPGGGVGVGPAVVRSVSDSFPYYRCFTGISGWGMHILASRQPLVTPNALELATRIPANARRDLLEWSPNMDSGGVFQAILSQELAADTTLNPDRRIRITDDHPYNEYFLLRKRSP